MRHHDDGGNKAAFKSETQENKEAPHTEEVMRSNCTGQTVFLTNAFR
jgi:hypothetical protein